MPSITRNTVASQFDIRIDLSDVLPKLKSLPRRIGTNVVRRGLLAGARVVGEEARIRAPQPKPRSKRRKKAVATAPIAPGEKGYWATGNLRRSIGWETRGVFRDASGVPVEHRAVVLIRKPRKGRRNARAYAHMVEYGTRPHRVGKGMHPGASPRPFMRPALDSKASEAIKAVEQTVRRELVVELGKLRSALAGGRR